MKSNVLKTITGFFAMIAVLSSQTAFTPDCAWAGSPKETKAEKAQRLQKEREQEEIDARLDKIDINTLDPTSAAALLRDRRRRQAEKDREQYRRYDGVNPKWKSTTVYTQDSELITPVATAPTFGPWVEIDGQRVRGVYRESIGTVRFQGDLINNMSFAGLEDDKGKVLLPCVYRKVHVIPGKGVILSSHIHYIYESYNVRTGQRNPFRDFGIIMSNYNFKSFVLINLLDETVDLKSSSPNENSADAAVKTIAATQLSATAQPATVQTPPERKKLPLAKMEFWNEQGENYLTFEKAAAITGDGKYGEFFSSLDHFYIAFPLTPTGEVAMLLFNSDWKPTGDYMPRAFMTGREMGMGPMIPSPFLENAWLKLAPDGKSFGSPVGTLGYMPLGTQWMSAARIFEVAYNSTSNQAPEELYWVVAYSTPEGLGWKWIDPHTQEPTGPMWKDVRQVESLILQENHSTTGPLIGVQEMNGRWKALHLPKKRRVNTLSEERPGRLGMYTFSPLVLSQGPIGQQDGAGHATLADLVDYAEEQALQARAQRIAYEKWKKHYDEVERPRIDRKNRWEDAWRSRDWRTIESMAFSLGGNYLVEFADKYTDATGDQLRRAALLVGEPAKKVAYERRAKLADEKVARAAAAREAASYEYRQQQQARKANTSSNSPQWDNWNSYKSYSEQSSQNAAKVQALRDYTYGRSNNPLLVPREFR